VPNFDSKGMIFIPIGPASTKAGVACAKAGAGSGVAGKHGCFATGEFFDFHPVQLSKFPSNSIENSEFGARYSSLLPIGNGLQASFIYLYEFRSALGRVCAQCGPGITGDPAAVKLAAGTFLLPGRFLHGKPRAGVQKAGSVELFSQTDYLRNNFFGLTGTYYDKDLTDIVYRYDFLWQPKINVAVPGTTDVRGGEWTEFSRWIIAADRPTYIPWISKQHTFLTAQVTETWYPDRPAGATTPVSSGGKIRELSTLGFLAATNWLMNGQLTATNTIIWDFDDNTGALTTTNVYRYSRNVLFGVNAQWFLGRSGRYTDPFLFSGYQRQNELEFTLTYEI